MFRTIAFGRAAFAGLLLVMAHPGPASAQDPARMDQAVRELADKDEFAGSVLVARGDEILFERGYGLANREWGAPNAGDTRFRLASVTKQFTAVAVLMLVEQGRIDLSAPVKTYLPDAPAAWDAVTVRHLLSHTGGIPDFTGFEDYQATMTRPTTLEELTARFRDRPLDFEPGARRSYSNSGYTLLTAIIERVGGRPYPDFLAEHLFNPLGMTDSGYDVQSRILERRASGYSPGPEGVINAPYIDMTVPQGAGGLYSTTRDLLKWEQGLFGGQLISPASLALMNTPVAENYGLGVFVEIADGHTVVSHSGGIEGFNTYLARDVEDGLTVAVLGNLNGLAPMQLGKSLMTLARGGEVTLHSELQAITIAPELLAEYVGVYDFAPDFSAAVTVAEDRLMVQATDQDAFELVPQGADAFFLREVDARITFNRDDTGAVTSLTLHQGGRDGHAPRR